MQGVYARTLLARAPGSLYAVKTGVNIVLDVLPEILQKSGDHGVVVRKGGPVRRKQQLKHRNPQSLRQFFQHRVACPASAAFDSFYHLD